MLQYFEKVQILSSDENPELVGHFGYILGISEENDIVFSYAIYFDEFSDIIAFNTEDVQGTGEIASRENFYSGHSIKVRVDEEGRGYDADN